MLLRLNAFFVTFKLPLTLLLMLLLGVESYKIWWKRGPWEDCKVESHEDSQRSHFIFIIGLRPTLPRQL